MARCMRASGCKPGMLVQNSYGYGLFTGGIGFHYGPVIQKAALPFWLYAS